MRLLLLGALLLAMLVQGCDCDTCSCGFRHSVQFVVDESTSQPDCESEDWDHRCRVDFEFHPDDAPIEVQIAVVNTTRAAIRMAVGLREGSADVFSVYPDEVLLTGDQTPTHLWVQMTPRADADGASGFVDLIGRDVIADADVSLELALGAALLPDAIPGRLP